MTTRTKKHTLSLYLPEHQGVSIDALTNALLPHAGRGSNQAFVHVGAVMLWQRLFPGEPLPYEQGDSKAMAGAIIREISTKVNVGVASVVQSAIALHAGQCGGGNAISNPSLQRPGATDTVAQSVE